MKFIAITMKMLTDRMPRKVAIACVIMSATLITFGLLFIFLGGAHDDAQARNGDLKRNLDSTTRAFKTAKDDRQFIVENSERYEALLRGDRLVPHTRRVALAQLQTLALQRGLSSMQYNFTTGTGPTGGAAATVAGGYRLQVEKVDIKLGAPLDTHVFEFVLDLADSFPGSAVVDQFALERAGLITDEALNQVSRSKDSGLIKGEVHFSWRTAQAQDAEGAKK